MAYGSVLTDTVQSSTAATAPVFKDGNGTQIGTLCRAWVNFNGTGTVAIRGSFNVSSITDNGTGNYTVNFTTALPDTNFMASVMQSNISTQNQAGIVTSVATGSVTVLYANSFLGGTVVDANTAGVAVFR